MPPSTARIVGPCEPVLASAARATCSPHTSVGSVPFVVAATATAAPREQDARRAVAAAARRAADAGALAPSGNPCGFPSESGATAGTVVVVVVVVVDVVVVVVDVVGALDASILIGKIGRAHV